MRSLCVVAACCVVGVAICELFSRDNGIPLVYREDGTLIKQELAPCIWCKQDNIVEVDDMAFVCKHCGYVSSVKIKAAGR